MNILIVDDEPLARENLRCLLEEEKDIHIIGECSNAIEAIGEIHRKKPDVVFLDIQMPRITGLEMVSMLDPEHRPYIVFLTAFEEYAIQAFEEHAFDYLLKPLEQERLAKTLSRLRQGNKQNIDLLSPPEERLKCIPCTGRDRWCDRDSGRKQHRPRGRRSGTEMSGIFAGMLHDPCHAGGCDRPHRVEDGTQDRRPDHVHLQLPHGGGVTCHERGIFSNPEYGRL